MPAYLEPDLQLPVAEENPGYYEPSPETQFHQIPTAIFHINTGDLPLPPRPLAALPMPTFFTETPEFPHVRRSPAPWSFPTPWEPFRSAMVIEHVRVDARNEITDYGNGYAFLRPSVDRMIGPTSELKNVERRVLPFLRSLTNLSILGTWVDETGPRTDALVNAAESMTNYRDLNIRFHRRVQRRNQLFDEVARLNRHIDALEAMERYAVRVALDACALLGGVELPTWPASTELAGVWLQEAKRDIVQKPKYYVAQCRARDLERWGVPCWIETARREHARLDAARDGYRIADPMRERRYQQALQSTRAKRVDVYIPTLVKSAPPRPSAHAIPSAEDWAEVKSLVLLLLSSTEDRRLSFNAFSCKMERLLGKAIWSGTSYEPNQHAADHVCWLKARDGAHETCHVGVVHASMEIPATWRYPGLSVASSLGARGMMVDEVNQPELSEPSVDPEEWFAVELEGYSSEQETEASRLASSYKAYGYRSVQAPQQLKDEDGRTIPRSRYQIQVLFKSRRQQQDACRDIRQALHQESQISVSLVDLQRCGYDQLNLFHHRVDPRYVNTLFARPSSLEARQRLIRLAPRYSVGPSISSVPAAARAAKEAVYLWRLAQFSLFEYDNEYMLPGYRPAEADAMFAQQLESHANSPSSSSSPQVPSQSSTDVRRTALPFAELPLARLGDIAFALNRSFSEDDTNTLRRLYLCLCTAQRRAPFTAAVFPFPGSPYRDLLARVMKMVQESAAHQIVEFTYSMGPPNSSIGVWDEKLTLDAHGRVKISMDAARPREWSSELDPPRVEAYIARCMGLRGLTQLQKRRKKNGTNKVTNPSGPSAAGPSSAS